MVAEQQITIPDHDAIRTDLQYMTARWDELPEPAVFEIRAFREGAQPQSAKFSPDWIEDAVDWCAEMNQLGFNIYAVRNPIRQDATGSAKDSDILAAFFLWADCDDDDSAGNVKRFDGPKYSAAVVTGRKPSVRVHTYWQLAEPCRDMTEWREMQTAIAQHFGSDRAVVNPSRIMRVGGTVAYPAEKKRAKGYQKELTTIRTQYPDERPRVTMEQMRRVFGAAAPASGGGVNIDIGPVPSLDRALAVANIKAGTDWRENVKRLVASYVARGWTDDEILDRCEAFTLPGWTAEETRADVAAFIKWTRDQEAANGGRYAASPDQIEAPQQTPQFDHKPGTSGEGWSIQSAADFTADFVAPEYVVEGVIQRGRLYTLTAPTGSGKTAVMLYLANCIATLEAQFCGREVEHGDVLFLAGENPDDVRARVIGMFDHFGVDPSKCRLHFIAGTFSIRSDVEKLRRVAEGLPNLLLVVVDTFAAYFDGDDENSNAQALDFARVVREITAFPSKPSTVMPAHPVKNATRANLTPKGGSSLLNEVDGNLTLWNADGLVTMHWQGKHRGPDFQPLSMELKPYECDQIRDRKGRPMPTVLAHPVLQLRATQIARETLALEDQLLLNIHDDDSLSIRERCVALRLMLSNGEPNKSRMSRLLQRLREQKLVKKFRTSWVLTKDGETAVNRIMEGKNVPPDTDE